MSRKGLVGTRSDQERTCLGLGGHRAMWDQSFQIFKFFQRSRELSRPVRPARPE